MSITSFEKWLIPVFKINFAFEPNKPGSCVDITVSSIAPPGCVVIIVISEIKGIKES